MNNKVKYFLITLFLILLQVTVFNNITINYGIISYIYIFIFLILPLNIKGWQLLLLGFFIGLIIDVFSNTGGTHAFATVFVAFIRPFVLKIFVNIYENESNTEINNLLSSLNFLKFSTIIIFIHNFILYFIDLFHFNSFFFHLFIVIINSLLTILFCTLFKVLLKKEK